MHWTSCNVCLFLQDDGDEWFLLQYPPLYDPDASKQQEHQKVQVDFKSKQEEDDANKFIIHRDQIGSLELIDSFKPEDTKMVKGSTLLF